MSLPTKDTTKLDDDPMPRRIRHLTSIQIRNLTPFPVRDAFASALSQPSGHSQFNSDGRLSDDLDATFGRKRGRRLSSASVNALRSSHFDNDNAHQDSIRRPSQSSRGTSTGGSKFSPRKRGVPTPASSRPPQRTRRISTTSSSGFSETSTHTNTLPTSASFPGLLQDSSQLGLEQVLESRLVETYLTVSISGQDQTSSDKCITLPTSISGSIKSPSHHSSHSLGRASLPSSERSEGVNSRSLRGKRGSVGTTPSSPSVPTGSGTTTSRRSSPPIRNTTPSHTKSPSAPHTSFSNLATQRASVLNASASGPPFAFRSSSSESEPAEIFRSPIHRPSTNPAFPIDARNDMKRSFGDLGGPFLHVEVWGNIVSGPRPRTGSDANHPTMWSMDKKGKMKEMESQSEGARQWQVLERWDVDLRQLTPFTSELASHPSLLPSNSLLITLSPPGRTFYFPSRLSHIDALRPPSRPPSPSLGYNSDPETSGRGIRSPGGQSRRSISPVSKEGDDLILPQSDDGEPKVSRYPDKPSATFHDLLRLVTQQTIVLENQQSLVEVVRSVDQLYTHNSVTIAAREVSERKATVRQLEAEKGVVEDEAQNLRNEIDARREDLKRRKKVLGYARKHHEEEVQEVADREEEIREERETLEVLRNRFAPTRSILLGVLASIYPIELLSPPDLLFAIVDVPLPIPVRPTDPAPPLSLSGWNSVTEDAVATALGYAAQLVHLTAVYMNVGLTYPITCVGSRSLIKDGISAMVGPRMFPLYSKGVDTYRFEYAVFLLNKDIELLMAGRDLRALDMRHTLPNLKNLLLTLTDPESPPIPLHAPSLMSSDTDSVLRSPVASSSSLASDDGTTQVVESGPAEETSDNHDTTSNAGSATPTKASHTVSTPKKSRAFFGLAPLSGFLRARNSPSIKAEPQVGQSEDSVEAVVTGGPSTNGGDPYDDEGSPIPGDEEDDRKTIRPDTEEESSVEDKEIVEPSPNGAPHTNGLTPPAAAAHVEKPFGSGIEAAETVPLASERVS